MIFADRIVREHEKEVDNMVNVLTWVFWLSLAVIALSELGFWDALRGEDGKTQEEKKPEEAKKD